MMLVLTILILVVMSSCAALVPPEQIPSPIPQEAAATATVQITSGVPTIEPTLEAMQLAIYLPETRTGDPQLDPIIDAVLRHDFPTLKMLTAYTQIGCTFADGLGGPPKCLEGESESTLVNVVPFLGPEGHHSRQAEYESWQGPDVLGLLAAYRTADASYQDPAYPAGESALVFLLPSGPETLTLQISEGRIVRYDYGFGGINPDDLELKAKEFLLPLSFNPVPTMVPWNSFQDPGGRFSFFYPPTFELLPADRENSWQLGDRIRVEILPYERSWISCFDQALGDCPIVELDQTLEIQGQEVRRIEGYLGAVGGYTPQEFLSYLFNLGDHALVMTVYALPFGTQVSDATQIWPLEGMELELFERTVPTVILN